MDAKSTHPMTYADSKTNIGITVGRRRTWLIAIPCSLPRFAQVHDRIWTRHERKLGTNMRRHDVAVSRQNALAYWLCRSAPEVPRVSVDWLAQISSSTIKQAVKWKKNKTKKKETCRMMFYSTSPALFVNIAFLNSFHQFVFDDIRL